MAIGTHAVSGSGEKEGRKRRVGEIWSGPGVVVPSRSPALGSVLWEVRHPHHPRLAPGYLST